MTVFVDDMYLPARVGSVSAVWCHLFAGPFDPLGELHDMAASIGLRRGWFQGPPKHLWPMQHYDVTKAVRARAVKAGAVQVTYMGGTGRIMHDAISALRAAENQLGCRHDRLGPPGGRLYDIARARYLELAAATGPDDDDSGQLALF